MYKNMNTVPIGTKMKSKKTGKIVTLVHKIAKGSIITPFLILLGGIGSLVKITYGNSQA